jgi:fructokinase
MHKTCTVPSSDIIVFGEVLFDIFSSADKVIGGAPFNVARHLAGFGLNPCFVSSTGNDGNGRNALDLMKKWDMKTRFVSVRDGLPTGTVNVSIIDGEPSYKIKADQAYDRIEMPVNGFKSPILYHGTLALRSPHNLKIVKQIKSRYRPFTFTDMNLRKPWYSKEIITYALESSFCVKMNRLELGLVAEMFQINSNDVPGICRAGQSVPCK